MATHSSIPAWGIPRQRSMAGYRPWGHRVTHDWATEQLSTHTLSHSPVRKLKLGRWQKLTFFFRMRSRKGTWWRECKFGKDRRGHLLSRPSFPSPSPFTRESRSPFPLCPTAPPPWHGVSRPPGWYAGSLARVFEAKAMISHLCVPCAWQNVFAEWMRLN